MQSAPKALPYEAQTGAFLDKVRELLQQADTVMSVGLNEVAGRTAYLAALHAAQALIFENTNKIVSSIRLSPRTGACGASFGG
jgi:hypothetical protein